jgi:WbqC-like protein family
MRRAVRYNLSPGKSPAQSADVNADPALHADVRSVCKPTGEGPMKLAVMQPYFFPYIGYFQLIAAADTFVVYDNIKYTKKGWINRNRLLRNGEPVVFSLPLKSDSDSLDVRDRSLASDFDRKKLLNAIASAYQRAPYFCETFRLISDVVLFEEQNLFRYLHNCLKRTCEHLGLGTEIVISSDVDIDHTLRGQEKVIALCEALGATTYLNPIGGVDLYSTEAFAAKGVVLKFLRSTPFEYTQFGGPFVPWLSIIDVMMFNPPDAVETFIKSQSYSEFVMKNEIHAATQDFA